MYLLFYRQPLREEKKKKGLVLRTVTRAVSCVQTLPRNSCNLNSKSIEVAIDRPVGAELLEPSAPSATPCPHSPYYRPL